MTSTAEKVGKGAVATVATTVIFGYTAIAALVMGSIPGGHGAAHLLAHDSGKKVEELWKWVKKN